MDKKECSYCASLGKSDAHTHNNENCPVLADMKPCLFCGASGPLNHTAMHCPQRQPVRLELKRTQKAPWRGLPVPFVDPNSYKNGEEPESWMYEKRDPLP